MRRLGAVAVGVLAAAWLSSVSRAARADGGDLESLLNETVVTAASGSAESSRDAPATSTVISGDALRKYGARTVAEALDLLALGTASGNSGTGGSSDMGARGVTIAAAGTKDFLVLLDGVRLNDITGGSASIGLVSGIPLELVDHIEVILGPGSVLYGSNAMLGVISIVTKRGKDISGARVGVESALLTSIRPWAAVGGTFRLLGASGEASTEFEYLRQWGPSLYAQPTFGGTDAARGGPYCYDGVTHPCTGVWGGASTTMLSQYEEGALVGHVSLGDFILGYSGVLSRSPTSVVASDFDTYSHSTTRRFTADLGYAHRLSSRLSLKADAWVNASDSETVFLSSWVPNCPDPHIDCRLDEAQESIVGGLTVAPSFDWLKDGTLVTLVGADAERRSGRSILNDRNDATNQPVLVSYGVFDRQDLALAAYGQQTWDPVGWFGLNVGGRVDADPRFSPVASPRLAARVDPWREGTIKLIYSQAFRAPSFYESYFNHPLQPSSVGLRPEYEQSIEGSIEQRFSGQKVLFGAFATHWTDLIDYYRFTAQEAAQYVAQGKAFLPPAYIERNLGSINNWGFNAAYEGTAAAGVLQYGATLTAAVAFDQASAGVMTPLPASPRAFGNAHVSYDLPGDLPTVALAANAEAARPMQGAFASGYSPAPYSSPQVVLHATVSGPVPKVRGLSYRITGFWAATDREPYPFGPGVGPSPQTPTPALVPIDRARAIAGLTYEF